MRNLIAKAGTIIASSAMVLSFAPATFAATNVTVSGNGTGSTTKTIISNINKNILKQKNSLTVVSSQKSKASTGGNKVSGNTGEGLTAGVTTGDATSSNTLEVIGGSNVAAVTDPCGCVGDTTVDVSGNGSNSSATVKIINSNTNVTKQTTETVVVASQKSNASTGGNTVKNNTGEDSDSSVETGNADSSNSIIVEAGSNAVGDVL